ncbi:hypothetical protein MYCTH_2293962 [Thermothelomyces thermophilus ATCC 42464]|uniref:Uncharacterized protein n=1 Tax=Thermothelomyces thermophilus (strain ATCC 42464 / BCRC 31852 / DSM 1799) TaxID=573729 RepID=G2Q6Q9_THET4|nr:uncharacterized protein MYCTH_2293962 [Thermothelomyces thermophilus ATCC 42464]AEO53089.1 hypothetical protein MYCTH_2293962 [Thermothelomyces thermophilus ATCC 42464]
MTDGNASPSSNLPPQRPTRHSSSPYREANAPDSSVLTATTSSAADAETHDQQPPTSTSTSTSANRALVENRLSGTYRAHKHRSSGGFLLADPLNRQGSTRHRDTEKYPAEKRQRISVEQHASAGAQHGQRVPQSTVASSSRQGPAFEAPRPSVPPDEGSGLLTTMTKRNGSLAGNATIESSPQTGMAQLDVESAQIVSMALNLSESRRLASRRNISQPAPPRLAPFPDSTPGGSLRYHLQQQRKMSRTASPKPDRSPRIGAGGRFTPLQPAFDPGAGFRYHFSTSTLARAQKAKEYLELMAQYRRLLELVPPLEPRPAARPWSPTPPVSPNNSAPVSRASTNNDPEPKIGRPYNPLQYVRNRKVRARERRTLDGEALGFNDVMKVSEWVDEVAKWVATGQARQPGNPALPPFAGAQTAELQASPPAANARAPTSKPKRPRVDWVIDPADLLADLYWLELDDNKKLVEDRHWRRVFPQGPEPPRPASHDDALRLTTPNSAKGSLDAHALGERATPDPPSSSTTTRHEHEHVLEAARDRAQQKFRALRGSHHRHTSSFTNRDLLRLRRGSLSESSDTDSDRRRRAKGAPTNAVRSVLEKQMEEMIAREQREAESHPLYDHEARRLRPAASMTPEREPQPPASRDASQRRPADTHPELSETEVSGFGLKPLPLPRSPEQATGRTSLDVPRAGRASADDDYTSQPNSPGLRPSPDIGRVPALGMDLSPMSSRAGSPHRNPLTRVKSIFRDRSKERSTEPPGEDIAATLTTPADSGMGGMPESASAVSGHHQRRPSRSPNGERPLGHRPHKSLGNVKLRGEDGGISLRSLLRGPRIDTVLRSGVSKVSEMLWRKEGDDSSSTSSSDSEAESRGRSRGPRPVRSFSLEQDPKRLLDAPQQLVPDYKLPQRQLQHPPARPISRRSSRFELLKPPRIDVQQASPSTSPPPVQVRTTHEASVGSAAAAAAAATAAAAAAAAADSQGGRDGTRAASANLNAALALPHRPVSPSSRQWSITDRSSASGPAAVSRREIARLRALVLSSGVHAAEMDRRAKARKLLPSPTISRTAAAAAPNHANPAGSSSSLTWTEIANLAPDAATRQRLLTTPLAQADLYPVAARTLAGSVQASTAQLQAATSRFATETGPALTHRVESLRSKVAEELTDLAQLAIDAADEANHDLVTSQRLKVKMVGDAMDKMLRRRRRRFRWVRRAGWLVVEWVLVGCMWYVWFLVMIVRVALGIGKGVVRGVRWLLWL